VPQPVFEDAFNELMETVARLEQGGLTLEESLDGFERGMTLYRLCEQLLDQAEQRVTRLVEEAALEPE
jgi:exodeoxyribonuclease VII small subunit